MNEEMSPLEAASATVLTLLILGLTIYGGYVLGGGWGAVVVAGLLWGGLPARSGGNE